MGCGRGGGGKDLHRHHGYHRNGGKENRHRRRPVSLASQTQTTLINSTSL
ncbi:hypothetical protein EYF80_060585 [Liparis tanakae]|uniref:Uncharacterized protein n=1 Tax=Liparis tanakae TaxID=230148 RepID=A0A4Z2EK12_9TELE|nr:hypothetical protein EYF80_060585 [Liparis tanakae]